VARTAVFTVAASRWSCASGWPCDAAGRPFGGMRWVRTILMVPLLATPVAVGVLWLLILDPTVASPTTCSGWSASRRSRSWLVAESLPTLVLIDVWQWTPMMTLLLLAGLSTLPEEPERPR